MSWVETSSPNFIARHAEEDGEDVVGVLELLEGARLRLARAFARVPGTVNVVVHPSAAQLDMAQPAVALIRQLTAPAARRYVAGWTTGGTVHVLAPRVLERRASSVPGSREMLMLAPAGLFAQLVVADANPSFPPPWRLRALRRTARWSWLIAGAGQYFSGQTAHARPAVARRLREGPDPSFPPGLRDAALLGGSVLDLLAREEGEPAVVRLASGPVDRDGPRHALTTAFRGRSLAHCEAAWRAHLARIAER